MTWVPPSMRSARVRFMAVRTDSGARTTSVPAPFWTVTCLRSKMLRTTLPKLVHLVWRHAGEIDGLFYLALEALAVVRGVFGDEDAVGIERDGEELTHLEQDGHDLRVGGVVEVEAHTLRNDGGIEDGANAVGGGDLRMTWRTSVWTWKLFGPWWEGG